ncbi:MAG: shikimate dehydrogenase [Bacteroidales bacterium]|nr:shikimate dehydrogenase [Bacteroidales bacterium]
MKYGLIGEHLGHSFSKTIHSLIGEYDYELLELKPEELDGFLKRREFNAINVTIPYKEIVIPYLHFVSEEVAAIGACNTIVNRDGLLYGYNTDYSGMKEMIISNGIGISGKKVLILGTGGTSKTAMKLAGDLGATQVRRVSRSKRDDPAILTYGELAQAASDTQVIINTTPCGMYPDADAVPVDISLFPQLEGVVDAVYNPLRSKLVLDALSRGIKASGGLYMLVSQAIYANSLFLGHEVYHEMTNKLFHKLESEKENICLIGMPASGKTSIGQLLHERSGREFIDSDDVVEARIGMPIPKFFAENGEKAFRDIESAVISELAKKSSCIIATGGGAVLNPANVAALKQNSRLYFIDRPLEALIPTSDRPLSSDIDALRRRYQERYPIYRAAADCHLTAWPDYDHFEQETDIILEEHNK